MVSIFLCALGGGLLWSIFFSGTRQSALGDRQATLAHEAALLQAILREDVRSLVECEVGSAQLALRVMQADPQGIPREQRVTWEWRQGAVLRREGGQRPRTFDFGALVVEPYAWEFRLTPTSARTVALRMRLTLLTGGELLRIEETLGSSQ